MEAALSRTPDLERHSESVVDEFINTVDEFRVKRRCAGIEDDLAHARRVLADFLQQNQSHPDASGAALAKLHSTLRKTSRPGNRTEGPVATDIISFDPLSALKGIISDLHGRYDAAVRQAIEVCRKQDDVQRQASEILPEAEHLLAEVGDRVRKVSD